MTINELKAWLVRGVWIPREWLVLVCVTGGGRKGRGGERRGRQNVWGKASQLEHWNRYPRPRLVGSRRNSRAYVEAGTWSEGSEKQISQTTGLFAGDQYLRGFVCLAQVE